jgi:hypothetical protein
MVAELAFDGDGVSVKFAESSVALTKCRLINVSQAITQLVCLPDRRMRGDRVDTPRCDSARLGVGGQNLNVPIAGVFDFSKLLPKDAPPIDGSLALDAFA